jgi:hypothetical protein
MQKDYKMSREIKGYWFGNRSSNGNFYSRRNTRQRFKLGVEHVKKPVKDRITGLIRPVKCCTNTVFHAASELQYALVYLTSNNNVLCIVKQNGQIDSVGWTSWPPKHGSTKRTIIAWVKLPKRFYYIHSKKEQRHIIRGLLFKKYGKTHAREF